MRDTFPQSGGKNKFVPKGFRNRASGFEERFEMSFGGLLKAQGGLAAIASVRVTAGQ